MKALAMALALCLTGCAEEYGYAEEVEQTKFVTSTTKETPKQRAAEKKRARGPWPGGTHGNHTNTPRVHGDDGSAD